MTDSNLPSGTDRVAAAVRLSGRTDDIIVNVQGDEPFMPPPTIDLAASLLQRWPLAEIATVSAPLQQGDLLDCSKVKVVCAAPPEAPGAASDRDGGDGSGGARALFFSRAPIGVSREALDAMLTPCRQGGEAPSADASPTGAQHACRLHVGVYAFRAAALQRFVSLPPSPLEELERLEQMRALEAGFEIVVGEVRGSSRGVDTPSDLRGAREWYAASRARQP